VWVIVLFIVQGDSITEEDEPVDVDFLFSDIFEFVKSGIEAIVNDQVTQRFVTEQLKVTYSQLKLPHMKIF